MHVDGFRFDLMSALTRVGHDVDMAQPLPHRDRPGPDAAARQADRRAVGRRPMDGYRVGEFPPPWVEWNDQYRDTVRDFWRGRVGRHPRPSRPGCPGRRDLYADDGRSPYASVNFVTAHDGFTLRDLVTYEQQAQRGQRRGQPRRHRQQPLLELRGRGRDRRPGRSSRCGAGSRREPDGRRCCLSTGVPMITAGDERGRTQGGNNNPYVQDNEISGSTGAPTTRGSTSTR